jgi:hypothetical protein
MKSRKVITNFGNGSKTFFYVFLSMEATWVLLAVALLIKLLNDQMNEFNHLDKVTVTSVEFSD